MLDAKSKIAFTGTEEEYEAVKAKLNAKVKVVIQKPKSSAKK